MNIVTQYKRIIFVTGIFIALVTLFTRCMDDGEKEAVAVVPAEVDVYTGDAQCTSCHRDIAAEHLGSAHHLTSMWAADSTIHGSFEKGKNVFSYNPSLKLAMERRDSGLYQVVYFNDEEKMAMQFYMTVGSGAKGQSFIERRGNRLFQMPITYFTAAHQWSNSPGFPNDKVLTDRPISARCLECHATNAIGQGGSSMEPAGFSEQMILGVGCERCHGPGSKHVAYHQQHGSDTTGKFIVNPALLSRQQQLDLCALCHSGKIQKTKPSFSFKPGDRLADYFNEKIIIDKAMASGEVEVHGNQYGLLTASKCFKQSNTLTCNSCHGAHANERNNLELLSSKCIACHDVKSASLQTPTHAGVSNISRNCIDCHMPKQESKAIAVYLEGTGKPVASYIRSHYIGIYTAAKKSIQDGEK